MIDLRGQVRFSTGDLVRTSLDGKAGSWGARFPWSGMYRLAIQSRHKWRDATAIELRTEMIGPAPSWVQRGKLLVVEVKLCGEISELDGGRRVDCYETLERPIRNGVGRCSEPQDNNVVVLAER